MQNMPVKPPRVGKQPKEPVSIFVAKENLVPMFFELLTIRDNETYKIGMKVWFKHCPGSEILMSVIRALSATDSNEQREDEKLKLEKNFKKSDKKLGDLIERHESDLVEVMDIFNVVTNTVTSISIDLTNVEDNLSEAKVLLESDLDEIERLYLKSVEHKYTIQILEEIETLIQLPQQLNEYLTQKQYLKATSLLIDTIFDRQPEFENVLCLQELKEELNVKKSSLHKRFFQEICRLLYVQSISDMERAINDNKTLQQLLNRQALITICELFRKITKEEFIDVTENKIKGPYDSIQSLMQLVRALYDLDETSDLVEHLKANMQTELYQLLNNAIKSVIDSSKMAFEAERRHLKSTNSNQLFVKALNLIFDYFKVVAYYHQTLVTILEYTIGEERCPIYDLTYFWYHVQIVLIELLKDCLDMDNIKDVAQDDSTAFMGDLSKYFLRKLPVTKKKFNLFRFDVSTNPRMNTCRTVISMVLNNKDKFGNILIIFEPLTIFLDDVLKLYKINLTKIHEFLHSYVTGNYLKRLFFKFHKEIDETIRANNAWRNVTLLNETTSNKPLLQSALIIEKSLKESENLINTLKTFKNHIISLLINLVQEYYETCYSKYSQIVQQQAYVSNGGTNNSSTGGNESAKLVYSASWISDNDIIRYLKSLTNWQLVKTDIDEDADEINQRNLHEAELLTSNLGDTEIQIHEIVTDVSSLKELAYLHESMEWLVTSLKNFSNRLDPQKIFENTIFRFEQFADLCLLLLHLEIRVQCFYYLSTKNMLISKDYLEPDQKIIEFKRFLIRLDEAMTFCLNSLKFKYIFDGLGELMAKIVINIARFVSTIDETTIQQMQRNIFTLQRVITNVTYRRELALDYANDFYELLYLTEDEILNDIVLNGRVFTDLEYTIAFRLLSRSKDGSNEKLNYKLQKLSQVLQSAKTITAPT